MEPNGAFTNLAWQAEIVEDGDITFRYRNVSYRTLANDQELGEGRQQNIYFCGGGSITGTMNWMIS